MIGVVVDTSALVAIHYQEPGWRWILCVRRDFAQTYLEVLRPPRDAT